MELCSFGWNDDWAEALASAGRDLEPGRVVLANRGACRIWAASGERDVRLSRSLPDAPVTGDWVTFEPETGRVHSVLPRRTSLSRKKAGRAYQEQVIAANVDVLFIVMGLDGDFNLRRLERYLVLAKESGATPIVVLNKSDLCDDLLVRSREVDTVTAAPVVIMAAVESPSVSQLHRYVEPRRTAALVGSSGTGKSTIVNALTGKPSQTTSSVRESDSRGLHTTTSREMFLLPAGWLLIDMPGIRELEVWTDAPTAGAAFIDITQLALDCRFRDCRHAGEPGCAVAAAVEAGSLEKERLGNFHKVGKELQVLQVKRQARIAQRAYRKFKNRW